MRGDRTFAYDLVMRYGAVSGRVVLLLRSAEAKPTSLSSVLYKTPPLNYLLHIGIRRGWSGHHEKGKQGKGPGGRRRRISKAGRDAMRASVGGVD